MIVAWQFVEIYFTISLVHSRLCAVRCVVYVCNQIVCSLLMAKVVIKWDSWVHKMWLDICIKEVRANNRPQHCLNSLGYANLLKKLTGRTKRAYTREQHENRWDNLKRTYT
jgi:hypothetical protein